VKLAPLRLTPKKLDRMIWLAHRRARARSRAEQSRFADNTAGLEACLMDEMRPHLIKILRLARKQLTTGL